MRVGGRGAKNSGFRCAPSRLRYYHWRASQAEMPPEAAPVLECRYSITQNLLLELLLELRQLFR